MKVRKGIRWIDTARKLHPGESVIFTDLKKAHAFKEALQHIGGVAVQRRQKDGTIEIYRIDGSRYIPKRVNHGSFWADTADRLRLDESITVTDSETSGLRKALLRRGKRCSFRRMEDGTVKVTVIKKK